MEGRGGSRGGGFSLLREKKLEGKAGRRSWLSLKGRKQQVGLFLLDQKWHRIHFPFTIQPSVRPSARLCKPPVYTVTGS